MTRSQDNRIGNIQATQYATSEDFFRIFNKNLDRLYLLSFLLTGDHEKAEQCFVGGLEDSIEANQVFRKWAYSWAKRTIVQNAIRVLQPSAGGARESDRGCCLFHWLQRLLHGLDLPSALPSPNGQGLALQDFELYPVLALEDFERFVFVMTVLERYSDHECALLLGSSIQAVRQSRVRAVEQIAASVTPAFSNEDSTVLSL